MEKKLWIKDVQEEVKEKQEKEDKSAKVASIVKAVWNLYSYTPPSGLFTKGPETIANQLKKDSSDLKQAMSRLNFYINRAGGNLTKERRDVLEKAKDKLRNLYASLSKEAIGRPPKGWWDTMEQTIKKKQPEYSAEVVDKVIGDIWHNQLSESKKKQMVDRYEHK